MIPKIIHQIWVGGYQIPERERNLAESLKNKSNNYTYYLWTDNNMPTIPDKFLVMYKEMYSRKDFAFCADLIRWLVVYEYGGWYLDIDWEFIQSLDACNIDHRDGIVYGHWGGGSAWLNHKIGAGWGRIDSTLANNVFAFTKNHPLLQYMIDNMSTDVNYSNAPYSPSWCGIEVKKYLNLENEFTQDDWVYHNTMKQKLDTINIEYGDYNTFQNEILKHHSLYSWSAENKLKFEQGLL